MGTSIPGFPGGNAGGPGRSGGGSKFNSNLKTMDLSLGGGSSGKGNTQIPGFPSGNPSGPGRRGSGKVLNNLQK